MLSVFIGERWPNGFEVHTLSADVPLITVQRDVPFRDRHYRKRQRARREQQEDASCKLCPKKTKKQKKKAVLS